MSAFFLLFFFVLGGDQKKIQANCTQMVFFGKFTQKSPYFHEMEKKNKLEVAIFR
jgi:hypothetical protein